jgi:hypothetical protein
MIPNGTTCECYPGYYPVTINSLNHCIPCPHGCNTCDNSDCSQCVENREDNDGDCECKPGFTEVG